MLAVLYNSYRIAIFTYFKIAIRYKIRYPSANIHLLIYYFYSLH